MKKNKKMMIISIIAFIVVFSLLIVLLNNNGSLEEQTVSKWYDRVTNNYDVVTVIGSKTCPHCQEYKPVITALAKKYKFKFFFFEAEDLNEEERNLLLNTYDLENYDGRVPYTFIIKNNKFASDIIGFSERDITINYLKENGIIK